jgi:uncharacterized protein (TIGR03067 family)
LNPNTCEKSSMRLGPTKLTFLIAKLGLVGVILACFVSPSLGDDPNPDDDNKKEIEKFQGRWSLRKTIANGETRIINVGGESLTFSQKSLLWEAENAPLGVLMLPVEYTFKIDIRRDPKTFSQWVGDSSKKGLAKTGIYRINKDTLEICFHIDVKLEDQAPKNFDCGRGSAYILRVYERIKKKAQRK